jgi:Fe-S oxidoreductase
MFEVLNEYETQLLSCLRCAECHAGCPVYLVEKNESYTARAKLRLMRAVMNGEMELSESAIEHIERCLNCNACMARCPVGIDTDILILKARHDMRKAGIPVPENLDAIRRNIAEHRNPFGLPASERGDWAPKGAADKESDLAYFAGCAVSYSQNKMAKAALRMLDGAGLDYTVLGAQEYCCGDPLERMGLQEEADLLRDHIRETLRSKGVKRVFTSCAGCTKALKHSMGDEFEVRHVTEVLDQMVKEGRVTFEKPMAKKVVYFDGCDLGRHAGVYDAPRQLLAGIPEVEMIEMSRNKQMGMCCGGPFMGSYPELAKKFASERIAEAQAAGAEIIAVACPTCLVNLKEGAKSVENCNIEVQDVSIILQRLAKK